jgi:hypothetical protein
MVDIVLKYLIILDREYLMVPIYLLYHVFLYKVGYWKMVDEKKNESKKEETI